MSEFMSISLILKFLLISNFIVNVLIKICKLHKYFLEYLPTFYKHILTLTMYGTCI